MSTPIERFIATGCSPAPLDELPKADPSHHDLTAEQWGIYGEGTPEDWDSFVAALNRGRLPPATSEVRVDLSPDAPDWGEPRTGTHRSSMRERGKALFCEVSMSPLAMVRLQGKWGEAMSREYGGNTEWTDFMSQVGCEAIERFAERFRQGEVPGPFAIEFDSDGAFSTAQEGRHRALATLLADMDRVPAILFWDTAGTFSRFDDESFIARYP